MSTPEVITLRYDRRGLVLDGARALIGLAATLGPIIFLETLEWLTWVLGGAAMLFGVFAAKTAARAVARVRLEGSMIHYDGLIRKSLDISAMDRVKLAYFGRRGSGRKGWMTLTLRAGGGRIVLDSTLERFEDLVAAVAATIRRNEVPLDPTSAHNFSVLGHGLEDE